MLSLVRLDYFIFFGLVHCAHGAGITAALGNVRIQLWEHEKYVSTDDLPHAERKQSINDVGIERGKR